MNIIKKLGFESLFDFENITDVNKNYQEGSIVFTSLSKR
jgi:hypothetical protein